MSCPFNLPFHILLNTQLEQEKMAVAFELEDMLMRPDPQPLLEELIYEVSSCDVRWGWVGGTVYPLIFSQGKILRNNVI